MVQVLEHVNTNVQVTEVAWAGLQTIARDFGISVSELLEQLGNKQLLLIDPTVLENNLDLRNAPESQADAEVLEEEFIAWEHIEELGQI